MTGAMLVDNRWTTWGAYSRERDRLALSVVEIGLRATLAMEEEN